MKFGLGTVQFGLDYGISNSAGQVSLTETEAIIRTAEAAGLTVLDTAAAYGSAETVLGKLLPVQHSFQIVTKLPKMPVGAVADVPAWVEETFRRSLARLNTRQVYGLLLHDAQDLLNDRSETLFPALERLKQQGSVSKIGASVYSGEEIDALLQRYPLDLMQLPINVLDQRLLSGGQLRRLKSAGVQIHARSLFLQGLLLMQPSGLPPYFDSVKPALAQFTDAAAQAGLSALQAAVAFAGSVAEIDTAVVGVTRAADLHEILAAGTCKLPADWFKRFALQDEKILNPALWPKFR